MRDWLQTKGIGVYDAALHNQMGCRRCHADMAQPQRLCAFFEQATKMDTFSMCSHWNDMKSVPQHTAYQIHNFVTKLYMSESDLALALVPGIDFRPCLTLEAVTHVPAKRYACYLSKNTIITQAAHFQPDFCPSTVYKCAITAHASLLSYHARCSMHPP